MPSPRRPLVAAFLLIQLPLLLLTASCSNTGFLGHHMAYDVSAEVKSDLTSPVSMNVGFESHSGVAVPPKVSLLPGELNKVANIAQGEVLSTISRLSIERVADTSGSLGGTSFDYITVAATGDAADKVTQNSVGSKISDKANVPSDTAKQNVMTQIAVTSEAIAK